MLAVGSGTSHVGDGLQAGGFGEVVDLDRLGKPAAPAEIGLENIDGAVFDQVQKSLATVVVFAGGDGQVGHGAFELEMARQSPGTSGSSSQRRR